METIFIFELLKNYKLIGENRKLKYLNYEIEIISIKLILTKIL